MRDWYGLMKIPNWFVSDTSDSYSTGLNGVRYMNCISIFDGLNRRGRDGCCIHIYIGGDKDSRRLKGKLRYHLDEDGKRSTFSYRVYSIPYTTDEEVIKRVKSLLSRLKHLPDAYFA